MLMKLVKGHTSDEKPRTCDRETLRFKEMPIMEVWSDREDKKKLLEELGAWQVRDP